MVQAILRICAGPSEHGSIAIEIGISTQISCIGPNVNTYLPTDNNVCGATCNFADSA